MLQNTSHLCHFAAEEKRCSRGADEVDTSGGAADREAAQEAAFRQRGRVLLREVQRMLGLRGVVQQSTPNYSPQSSGIAERMNRTLQDKARTMMLESGLPDSMWGEILLTSCVLRNLTPTSSLSVTPLQMWTGEKLLGPLPLVTSAPIASAPNPH